MGEFKKKALILNDEEFNRMITRIGHEIVENIKDLDNCMFVGIRRRGVPISERIHKVVKEISGMDVSIGTLDINLYRDDLSTVLDQPVIEKSELPGPVVGKTVILFDDVLYTGRTIRSALDSIIDMGRPKSIKLVVLVDRGHRELPIRADFVGKNVPTSAKEIIHVKIKEYDGVDEVEIVEVEGE